MSEITREEIQNIVKKALVDICDVFGIKIPGSFSGETFLYGGEGFLSSLQVISLVVGIEDEFSQRGIDISIVGDKIFSQDKSPFTTVGNLVDFLESLL